MATLCSWHPSRSFDHRTYVLPQANPWQGDDRTRAEDDTREREAENELFDIRGPLFASVVFSGLRNRPPKRSEVVIGKANELRISDQPATASNDWESARQLGIGDELVPEAHPIDAANAAKLRLYPTYGTVEEVDLIRGRVIVRLLQSSFPRGVSLRMPDEDLGVLTRKGQRFKALATLATSDPKQFYLGNIRAIVTEVPDNFAGELRRLTQPSREFRF